MPPFALERVIIEIISAIACFIIMRFMLKPFQLTKESRYLGLPLGFGFLGMSYALSAIMYSPLFSVDIWIDFRWVQVFVRGFAFLFLVLTYYFSKSQKKLSYVWKIFLGTLLAFVTFLILLIIILPEISQSNYLFFYIFSRLFGIVCLVYLTIHTVKSHLEQRDLRTLLTPFAFISLVIDQYSSIIWRVDASYLALFGGLFFRISSFAVFLFLLYKAFYGNGK
jgi:hypothetical protein